MRFLSIALLVCATLAADPLGDLARDFWKWRAVEQPISQDDTTYRSSR